jgi:hypothetical protein
MTGIYQESAFRNLIAFLEILARYNHHAMLPTPTKSSRQSAIFTFALVLVFSLSSACTFYADKPARAIEEATGGEGLERVFWKNVQTANTVGLERALASNYSGVTSAGTLDRSATIEQYKTWQLKDYSIGDLQTELNGSTIVVTYTITMNGTMTGRSGASEPLPSTPQHMMTVWQQQKKGWIAIAHSSSQ